MQVIVSCLAALLSCSLALPLEKGNAIEGARNTALEQAVLDALEDLRQTMINGSDDVPVLDPLVSEYLDLDLEELLGLENSRVTMRDTTVRYLSTFEIDSISISLTGIIPIRYTLELVGHIPVIEVQNEFYDLEVNVMDVNVFGTGKSSIKVVNPSIRATLVLSASIIGGFSISSANVQFHLSEFETIITGLFDDEPISQFAGLFLSLFVPEAVEYFEEDITEAVSAVVLEYGNKILNDLDLSDILNPPGVLAFQSDVAKSLTYHYIRQ